MGLDADLGQKLPVDDAPGGIAQLVQGELPRDGRGMRRWWHLRMDVATAVLKTCTAV